MTGADGPRGDGVTAAGAAGIRGDGASAAGVDGVSIADPGVEPGRSAATTPSNGSAPTARERRHTWEDPRLGAPPRSASTA